jgi:hypothetical protein
MYLPAATVEALSGRSIAGKRYRAADQRRYHHDVQPSDWRQGCHAHSRRCRHPMAACWRCARFCGRRGIGRTGALTPDTGNSRFGHPSFGKKNSSSFTRSSRAHRSSLITHWETPTQFVEKIQ